MLPNWLGIGSGRAGTTKVWSHLKHHPDIFMPAEKETHFFDARQDVTADDIQEYERTYFSGVSTQTAIGEISPTYLCPPIGSLTMARNIRKHLGPDVKFVVNIRHPVHRAFSDFLFAIKSHYVKGDFCQKFFETGEIPENADRFRSSEYYIRSSLYSTDVSNYFNTFRKENFFFMVLEEDFGDKIGATLDRLCTHIGVEHKPLHADKGRVNSLETIEIILPDGPGTVELSVAARPANVPSHVEVDERSVVIRTGWYPWDSVQHDLPPEDISVYRSIKEKIDNGLPAKTLRELYERVFSEDVRRLEDLIGRDLSVWRA